MFVARVGWLILPVVAAGLAHAVVLKTGVLPWLAMPIDGGRQWGSRPLFGANKTWRGMLVMTAVTAGGTRLQARIGRNRHDLVLGLTNEYRTSPSIAGGIIGLSYSLAELPNSFVKRRLGLPPGARSGRWPTVQYVVDQADSVIGCLLALRLLYRPRRGEVALALALGTTVHVGVDQLLYALGAKSRE